MRDLAVRVPKTASALARCLRVRRVFVLHAKKGGAVMHCAPSGEMMRQLAGAERAPSAPSEKTATV